MSARKQSVPVQPTERLLAIPVHLGVFKQRHRAPLVREFAMLRFNFVVEIDQNGASSPGNDKSGCMAIVEWHRHTTAYLAQDIVENNFYLIMDDRTSL